MSSKLRHLSACLLLLWILPSLSAAAVGWHQTLTAGEAGEHHHGHAETHGHIDLAALLANVVEHGHHHEETEATPDHSHDVTLTPSKVTAKPHLEVVATPSPAAHIAMSSPPMQIADKAPRLKPPPPLFTSHCSLLL